MAPMENIINNMGKALQKGQDKCVNTHLSHILVVKLSIEVVI